MTHVVANIEEYFKPKKVYTPSDWLVTQKESGQTPKRYQNGGPNISWMNKRNNRILLFVLDPTIDEQTSELFKAYCEAYFLGCEITLVRPGSKLTMNQPRNAKAKVMDVPEDFMGKHKIANRINGGQ